MVVVVLQTLYQCTCKSFIVVVVRDIVFVSVGPDSNTHIELVIVAAVMVFK